MQRRLVVYILCVDIGLHALIRGVFIEKGNDSVWRLISDRLEELVVRLFLEIPPVFPSDHLGRGAGSIELKHVLSSSIIIIRDG